MVTLLAALFFLLFSLAQVYIVFPKFVDRLVEDAHDEAIRDGQHITGMLSVRRLLAGNVDYTRGGSQVEKLKEDFMLWKLKIFGADGTVLYSSDHADIGEVNTHDYFQQVVARGKVHTTSVWGKEVTLEGEKVPFDVVETYIPVMEEGVFLGAAEIYYDITQRKEGIDKAIMQASFITFGIGGAFLVIIAILAGKVERMMKERETLVEQLIRADRLAAIGTLVGGMTHEFNNINVTVMGFSQLVLERKDLPGEVRSHLERINRAAIRANAITNNLLDFTREGKSSVTRGNLSRCAKEALALVREQYEKEGIIIREHLDPVHDSMMDKDQIVQVLLNLFANSRDALAASETKVLNVSTGSEGSKVYVAVTDSGCGIPEEEISQIFTPFYSRKGEHAVDRAQAFNRGTGLGLSVCHTIVTNHGGDIHVESSLGRGTTLKIRLPAAGQGEGEAEVDEGAPS
jgi:signal transduction histidine kinase